jgi:hypothetical protein
MRLGLSIVAAALVAATPALAANRNRPPKAVVEFAPSSQAALSTLEVEISNGETASPARQPVTDAALFVSKAGGDANAALEASSGSGQPQTNGALFTVRLFIVAGGQLYTGGRGQCAAWDGDVARCSAGCDGGTFAVRRHGAAALELLLGAVAGAEAGVGRGITVSACGYDEEADVRLVPKSGRGLSVTPFGND